MDSDNKSLAVIPDTAFHIEREAIVEMLEADVSQGLTDHEVEARQAKYGLNTLEEEAKDLGL